MKKYHIKFNQKIIIQNYIQIKKIIKMIENVSFNIEVEYPELFTNIRRNINMLNQSKPNLRRQAIKQIHKIIITQNLSSSVFQQIANLFIKNILKCFQDQSQLCRQFAVKIISQLISRCQQINTFLPFIFSILVDRTNCIDLQGIQNIPEVMRPPPNQKPKVLIKLNQNCEQIRLSYCSLLQKILGLTEADILRNHLDDIVNIIRTLVMDPCSDIQKAGCETLQILCKNYRGLLLHYTQTICRALLLPIISKKSKIRIVSLQTLTAALYCGLWKYNAFVFQNLIGFRDPNSVAIKDFYSPTANINYLATLIIDSNIRVRQAFLKSLNEWICKLDDKFDHHGKLVPYVLSGLFDEDANIRKIAYDTIEDIGNQIQIQKQKQFRDSKQYAIDAAWTWQGKLVNMKTIDPFINRPRLGSRFFIRGHVRKFWHALYKQIKDINLQNRIRGVKLALMGVIYTQNYMTSHLDKFIPPFITSIYSKQKQEAEVCKYVQQIFYFLGRYCEYSSYEHIIKSGIKGQLVQNQQFIRCTFKALGKLMQGNLDAIPQDTGLCHKKKDIYNILNMISQMDLFNQISSFNNAEVEFLIITILQKMNEKAKKQEIQEILKNYFIQILKLLFISFYEKYFGKDLIITIKNIDHITLPSNPHLFQIIKPYFQQYKGQFQAYLSQIFNNPPTFVHSDWKFLIVSYIYLLFSNSKQNQQLVVTVLDVIGQSMTNNRVPQMVDFALKIIKIILRTQKLAQVNNLNQINKLLKSCCQNFAIFKPYKKVPVYIQVQKSQNNEDQMLKIQQPTYTVIFNHIAQAIQLYQIQNLKIEERDLAEILFYFYQIIQHSIKFKQIVNRSIKSIWVIFQRLDLNNFNVQKFAFRNIYILPKTIDYLIQRIESTESLLQNSQMVFGTFIKIVKLFPQCQSRVSKLPYHYPNYPDLYEKLFKYALDEKDVQTKNKFLQVLLILCNKMYDWFKVELDLAKSKNRYERARLIEGVISYCHK